MKKAMLFSAVLAVAFFASCVKGSFEKPKPPKKLVSKITYGSSEERITYNDDDLILSIETFNSGELHSTRTNEYNAKGRLKRIFLVYADGDTLYDYTMFYKKGKLGRIVWKNATQEGFDTIGVFGQMERERKRLVGYEYGSSMNDLGTNSASVVHQEYDNKGNCLTRSFYNRPDETTYSREYSLDEEQNPFFQINYYFPFDPRNTNRHNLTGTFETYEDLSGFDRDTSLFEQSSYEYEDGYPVKSITETKYYRLVFPAEERFYEYY